MTVSTAFAGCSPAYAAQHMAGRTCLDDAPHDGSPCLLTDDARATEALALLADVPEAARGEGVTLDAAGRPTLRNAS